MSDNNDTKIHSDDAPAGESREAVAAQQLARPQKSFFQAALPVFACGAGLFSDGYVNNVIGSVSTVLSRQYPGPDKDTPGLYDASTAKKVVPAIAFAGTVVGQLVFGFCSDHWSRSNSLLVSTIILIVFTALASGSYFKGDAIGMFNMLTAWRFFVGIGIGGEYPAGSVASAEASGELKSGTRNRWFILFTNTAIDWGFVFGAFVPYAAAAATHNLDAIWRASLAVGVIFPMILFVLRLRLKEPEEFSKESMRHKTPYSLVFKYYWVRLVAVSIVWFLYDFSTYAFGIYSSTILDHLTGKSPALTKTFGWNTVTNMFYLPGTIFGAFVSDWLGPKYTLMLGVTLQSLVGYIMASQYAKLNTQIAAFAVVYGIFLALGELGPGNNIGLLASKSCATGVRGRYYGIAAAIGKIGAFVGTYVFPYIKKKGDPVASAQYPFWVASSLCILSAIITYFFIPNVGQDTITEEDIRFREYLEANGWDTAQLGLAKNDSSEEVAVEHVPEKP